MLPQPRGLSILAKEITVATHMVQSSSNELSTPISVSINVNKRKINIYTLKFQAYVETADSCKVKLAGFRSQFETFHMSSHTGVQRNSLSGNDNIHIYIYIVIHRQICFVLSELISVARQYLPVAGIETRLTQMPSQSF